MNMQCLESLVGDDVYAAVKKQNCYGSAHWAGEEHELCIDVYVQAA